MLNLPGARDVPAGGGDEPPLKRYRSLRDELATRSQPEMLAGVDDFAECLNRLPQFVVGGVERGGGEADDVRGPEVGDNAARLERPRDSWRLVVLDGEVAAAPLRLARGADGEGVGRRGEPGLLQQPR